MRAIPSPIATAKAIATVAAITDSTVEAAMKTTAMNPAIITSTDEDRKNESEKGETRDKERE